MYAPAPPPKKKPQRFQYFPWPVHSFQISLLGSWHHLPSHSRNRLRNLPRLSLPYCTIEVETRSVPPSLSISTLIHVSSFLLQTRGGFSNLLLLDLSLPLPGTPYYPLGNPLSLIWWLSMSNTSDLSPTSLMVDSCSPVLGQLSWTSCWVFPVLLYDFYENEQSWTQDPCFIQFYS